MKALTLWQPWASLIAIGAKRIETRGWRPPATLDRLVICAAKRPVQLQRDVTDVANADRIYRALEVARESLNLPLDLPLGAALCVVRVGKIYPTEDVIGRVGADELAFGNYARGRFAWVLIDLRRFAKPFPVTGRQGLFDVDDELVAKALT